MTNLDNMEDVDADIETGSDDDGADENVTISKSEYEKMQNKIAKMQKKKEKAIENSTKRALEMADLERALDKRDFMSEHPSADFDVIEAVAEKKGVSYKEAYGMISGSSQSFIGTESVGKTKDEYADLVRKAAQKKGLLPRE